MIYTESVTNQRFTMNGSLASRAEQAEDDECFILDDSDSEKEAARIQRCPQNFNPTPETPTEVPRS